MERLIDNMNVILANSLVTFAKIHNYHWNIRGMQFYALHAKTEEMYQYFGGIYDDIAERILQLGGKPLITLKSCLEKATIKEDDHCEITAHYVMKHLLEDYISFHARFREITQMEDCDDITSSYCQEQMTVLEKEIWMLKSVLK